VSRLLETVRVIECATLRNGDNLGMMLGDLGADVIKVEAPGRGDYLRIIGGQITPQHSRAHVHFNRNKRSMTLDLRSDEGRQVFWDLHASADVFVDGFIAGACDKLGVGYEDQRARNPGIVYCQYSGFGVRSPYAQIPTHGQMMDALAGKLPTDLGADGFLHQRVQRGYAGGTLSGGEGTLTGALYGVSYVLAALLRRGVTGEGTYIDVSAADACVTSASTNLANELNAHRLSDTRGAAKVENGENTSAKYQFYETRDRHVILFCGIEHKFWENFCRAIDRHDLLTQSDKVVEVDFGNDASLRVEMQQIFHQRDLRDWVQLAIDHDIAMGPAHRTLDELRADEHFNVREVFVEGHHPHAGPFTYIGRPAVIRDDVFEIHRPAPLLGEHTNEILDELGYDADRTAHLRSARIV
jgi:crotonobetainyl-CoA:carnitine CoA-transferase CaiB-like acyl-CoA transferase